VRNKRCISLGEDVEKLVNDWRKEQEKIPNFSRSIEALVVKGLEKP
jgi:hypothetical protein